MYQSRNNITTTHIPGVSLKPALDARALVWLIFLLRTRLASHDAQPLLPPAIRRREPASSKFPWLLVLDADKESPLPAFGLVGRGKNVPWAGGPGCGSLWSLSRRSSAVSSVVVVAVAGTVGCIMSSSVLRSRLSPLRDEGGVCRSELGLRG